MKKLSETYKELGIAFSFPIRIKNENGNRTYYEDSDGFWVKREYDAQGNEPTMRIARLLVQEGIRCSWQ